MKNTVKKVSSLLTVTAIMAAMICNSVVSSSAVESREEKIPKITVSASAEEKATAEKIYAYLIAGNYSKAKTELENNPTLNLNEYPFVVSAFKIAVLKIDFSVKSTVDELKNAKQNINELNNLYNLIVEKT